MAAVRLTAATSHVKWVKGMRSKLGSARRTLIPTESTIGSKIDGLNIDTAESKLREPRDVLIPSLQRGLGIMRWR